MSIQALDLRDTYGCVVDRAVVDLIADVDRCRDPELLRDALRLLATGLPEVAAIPDLALSVVDNTSQVLAGVGQPATPAGLDRTSLAVGVLMATADLSPEDAHALLVSVARSEGVDVVELAQWVVDLQRCRADQP